jgi:hypothetical protein
MLRRHRGRRSRRTAPCDAQAAFFSGGHWSNTITISTNVYGNVNSFGLPGIGFNSHSQATLIWAEITTPSHVRVESGEPRVRLVEDDFECYDLQWSDQVGGELRRASSSGGRRDWNLTGAVVAIGRDLTGAWGTPATVAASAYRQNNPNVGLGNDGSAVVVWRTRTGVSYAVRSGGSWSAAAPLPVLVGQADGSRGVAVDGSGNAVAIFTQVTISPGTYATYRPVGGWWQTKVQLSSGVPVAVTPAGTFCSLGNDGVDSASRNFKLDYAHLFR